MNDRWIDRTMKRLAFLSLVMRSETISILCGQCYPTHSHQLPYPPPYRFPHSHQPHYHPHYPPRPSPHLSVAAMIVVNPRT